jgi:hypothetical protein
MWCIKNILQTSTAQLLLDMLAVKSNNIDPLALLDIPVPSLHPSHTLCLLICAHVLTHKPV